ncbi:MAG: hypothetical protein WBB85_14220 [Albidovulum sp.]|uniref:anti-sigma factor family protein n=1 Tax=Albidovulum sp. TaxID=1872424 RepID=UPI003C8DCEDC
MMDGDDREQRGADLLPFYVNGTLSPEEQAEVEALLAEDEDLRQQRDLLTRIRNSIKSEGDAYSPGELGLARLMGAVGPKPRHYGLLAASVAAASVALGTVLYQATADRAPTYEQAGGPTQAATLLVAFQPHAPQGEISDLLLANDLSVVDGPSAIGLYRVLVSEEQSQEDALAALRAASALVESAGVAE